MIVNLNTYLQLFASFGSQHYLHLELWHSFACLAVLVAAQSVQILDVARDVDADPKAAQRGEVVIEAAVLPVVAIIHGRFVADHHEGRLEVHHHAVAIDEVEPFETGAVLSSDHFLLGGEQSLNVGCTRQMRFEPIPFVDTVVAE